MKPHVPSDNDRCCSVDGAIEISQQFYSDRNLARTAKAVMLLELYKQMKDDEEEAEMLVLFSIHKEKQYAGCVREQELN